MQSTPRILWPRAAPRIEQPIGAALFTGLRVATFLGLYAGLAGVLYGLQTFEAGSSGRMPISPAVRCTVALATAFFSVYAAVPKQRNGKKGR